MNLREKFLQKTIVYKNFKNLVSPPSLVLKNLQEYMPLDDGLSVLDLGCGYGDVAFFYSERCSYLGIDSNSDYISEAKRRNAGSKAEFIVADVNDPVVLARGPFDLVIMIGVLHHLNESQVRDVAKASQKLLAANGKFVAMEPVFAPDQRLSARLLIASDRGRFVRDESGYKNLLESGFPNVETQVVHGLLRIPYSHVIITCGL
jgi:cyclopropane fatty-acyl-phospholipid synthase-like methyltransferase